MPILEPTRAEFERDPFAEPGKKTPKFLDSYAWPTAPGGPKQNTPQAVAAYKFHEHIVVQPMFPPDNGRNREVLALLPEQYIPHGLLEFLGLLTEQLYEGNTGDLHGRYLVLGPADLYPDDKYRPRLVYLADGVRGWTALFYRARVKAEAANSAAEQERREKETAQKAEQLKNTAEKLRAMADAVLLK